MNIDREKSIRNRAYEIWHQQGCPDGRDQEHWDQAAREMESAEDTTGTASGAQPMSDPETASKPAALAASARSTKSPRSSTLKS
jgi:hypothetical protein